MDSSVEVSQLKARGSGLCNPHQPLIGQVSIMHESCLQLRAIPREGLSMIHQSLTHVRWMDKHASPEGMVWVVHPHIYDSNYCSLWLTIYIWLLSSIFHKFVSSLKAEDVSLLLTTYFQFPSVAVIWEVLDNSCGRKEGSLNIDKI